MYPGLSCIVDDSQQAIRKPSYLPAWELCRVMEAFGAGGMSVGVSDSTLSMFDCSKGDVCVDGWIFIVSFFFF